MINNEHPMTLAYFLANIDQHIVQICSNVHYSTFITVSGMYLPPSNKSRSKKGISKRTDFLAEPSFQKSNKN